MRKDGVIRTFTTQIERVTDLQGNTLSYNIVSTGTAGYRTVRARMGREQVPEFVGNFAWAEVQKVSAKPWAIHRFVRFIDPPAF